MNRDEKFRLEMLIVIEPAASSLSVLQGSRLHIIDLHLGMTIKELVVAIV